MNLRCFKLNRAGNRAYSISFNSSNFCRFFWSWILKDCIKVQKKKKKVVVLCSRPWQNVKISIDVVEVQGQQRNVQKSVMHVKSCFFADLNQELLSKPIALLPFSWPSPLSLLQLPLKLRRRRQCQPMSGYWNKQNDNSARDHAFLYNFLVVVPACTITTWNDKISSSLENVNAKAINFAIPVCTRTRALANFPSQVTGWHGIIAKTF